MFAGALAGQELPQLRGYVRTRAKPTAEVVLSSDNNDPILAQWQYGRGRAIAWTSDVGADWAEMWLAWDGFAPFLRQAVQWVSPLPGAVGDSPRAAAVFADGAAVIEVDAVDAAGRFLNGLATNLAVVGPDGAGQTLVAEQVDPDAMRAGWMIWRRGCTRSRSRSATPPASRERRARRSSFPRLTRSATSRPTIARCGALPR